MTDQEVATEPASPDQSTPASRSRGQLIGPVTTAGAAIGVLGTVAYVAGWRLGWIELMVVAGACLIALLLAIPFILGKSRVHIDRTLADDRITAGDDLEVVLTATNPSRLPARRVDVDEQVGGDIEVIRVPTLAAGATSEHPYSVATSHRERLVVGPAVISRADPLRLLRRQSSQSGESVCWVYPRTTLLGPLPVGFAKDLEGPTSDTSPAGDVAFHAVRPYVIGDDRRHIHWLSTAKTGSLMVRHYVDNRRPHLAILLDTHPDAYSTQSFETAVSIAASLTLSMMRKQLPVSLRIGTRTVLGTGAPGTVDTALEALTECSTAPLSPDDLTVSTAEFLRLERGPSALAIITGARADQDLLGAVMYARRRARPIAVPVVDPDFVGERVTALPATQTLPCASLDEFRGRWAVLTR